MENTDKLFNEYLINILENNDIRSICDFGCGNGERLIDTRDRHPEIKRLVGIDQFSLWSEDERPNPDDSAYKGIRLVDSEKEDIETLFSDPYDLVITTFTIHHFKYPVREINRIGQLVKPGGLLFLGDFIYPEEPEKLGERIRWYDTEMFFSYQDFYHRRPYTLDEAIDLLGILDLDIIESKKHDTEVSREEIDKTTNGTIERLDETIKNLDEKMKNHHLASHFRAIFESEKGIFKENPLRYNSVMTILGRKR